MEKHTSKKLFACILALSAGAVLASCDPITVTPTNYETNLVLDKDGNPVKDYNEKEMKDNLIGKIYDAISTDRNTKIVSDLLEEIATNKFGTYAEIDKVFELVDGEVNIKNQAEYDKYVNDHADVFKKDDDAEGQQLARAKNFYKDIMERISEVFYNEITSGSYNDDEGRFDESKLYMAHYYEFYDITAPTTENKFFVTSELTKENAFSKLLGKYSNDAEGKRGYIEEKIFPQILKDKLVEEYVYNNKASSLGRSYAREVSYIKVSYENHVKPWEMLKHFANEYIKFDAELDFEIITAALKGFEKLGDDEAVVVLAKEGDTPTTLNGKAYKLLEATYDPLNPTPSDTDDEVNSVEVPTGGFECNGKVLIPAGNYYKETKLGQLIVSYKKALKAVKDGRFPSAEDKAELDKFTSGGKSMEYGLREKLLELSKEDYTTDGWFIKNGGLSELPAVLRDRLFNINVANSLDSDSLLLENSAETLGKYEYAADGETALKRLPYLRNVYGHKFVIPAKSLPYAEDPFNYIYQDVEGKAFYIVQVLEAPSTAKLNKDVETVYPTSGENTKEDIAKAVAKVLGTKDSYIKDAYTEILKTYDFVFYETSLYEHFKSEYPDLFDDED